MEEIKTNYKIGQAVYLITDPDQFERIVTGIVLRPNSVSYYLSFITMETMHYDFEIATEKNWKK